MQMFHVKIVHRDIYLDSYDKIADFLYTLVDYGSPRIVSYDAIAGGPGKMVLEFTSYENAMEFTMDWFGETAVNVKKYVETITV